MLGKRAEAISIDVSSVTVYSIDHMAVGAEKIYRLRQRVYFLDGLVETPSMEYPHRTGLLLNRRGGGAFLYLIF